MPILSLADILLGRGVPVPAEARHFHGKAPPPPPPLPPPMPRSEGDRLLQVVKDAVKKRSEMKEEILGLLSWQNAPAFPLQQREEDAIFWTFRASKEELFSVTDNYGSTVLVLSCRLGMEKLCDAILSAANFPEAGK